jgi:hypothetical protein
VGKTPCSLLLHERSRKLEKKASLRTVNVINKRIYRRRRLSQAQRRPKSQNLSTVSTRELRKEATVFIGTSQEGHATPLTYKWIKKAETSLQVKEK